VKYSNLYLLKGNMKLDIQKIKLLMRKNKIGQTQLGNSIGRSREWVSKFMNEKLEPKKK
jgi:predicted XRE-type DNA-binding protein